MTREEELELGSYKAYPSQVEYSSVGDCLKDYNAEQRRIWLEGAKWADRTMIEKACEWLRLTQPQVIMPNTTIERFKKAMEE